jgi:hypothetical protein
MKSQADAYVKQACIDFQTQCEDKLAKSRNEILSSKEMLALDDKKREEIEANLNNITITYRSTSIDNLRDMANDFVGVYIDGGQLDGIKRKVREMVAASGPAVTVTTTSTTQQGDDKKDDTTNNGGQDDKTQENGEPGSKVAESKYTPTHVKVKRKISSRQELQDVIDQLTQILDKVDDNSPVEFTFNNE